MQQQAERLAHLNATGQRLRRFRFVGSEEQEEKALAGGAAAFLSDELKELETRLKAKRVLVEEMRQHVGPPASSGGSGASNAAASIMSASMRRELASPDTVSHSLNPLNPV